MTKEQQSAWDDVRRIADELEVKMHLARMEARDRWEALKPRLGQLQQELAKTGKRANEAIEHELSSIGAAVRRLRDDLAKPGW